MKKTIRLIVLTLITVAILAGCCHEQYKLGDCPYCGGLGYYTCSGCNGTYDCGYCR